MLWGTELSVRSNNRSFLHHKKKNITRCYCLLSSVFKLGRMKRNEDKCISTCIACFWLNRPTLARCGIATLSNLWMRQEAM